MKIKLTEKQKIIINLLKKYEILTTGRIFRKGNMCWRTARRNLERLKTAGLVRSIYRRQAYWWRLV